MRYMVNDPEINDRNSEDTKRRTDIPWYNWDEMKTKRETKLVIVVGLLAVVVIALAVTLVLQIAIFSKVQAEYKEMCQTEKCIKTAARLIESINKSVDPCDDFYKFACGGWINQHPIPQSQTSWDQLSLLRENLLENLRTILEDTDQEDDVRPVKLARTLYRTCMDTATIESLGLEPIYKILRMIKLPEKPVFNDSLMDLPTISGLAQRYLGFNLFINFYISEDIRNTSRNRMMIEQVSPGFSERYLLDHARFGSEIAEYRHYIKSMVELVGVRVGHQSAKFADEILEFSTSIAKIMATQEERRSANHLLHILTIDELQQLTDLHTVQWNWTDYVKAVFENTNITIDTSDDGIIVTDLEYLQKLPELLANTHPETVARFVWWNVFATLAPLTLQKFRDLGFQFSQKVFGLKEKIPRWKGCTGNVNSMFGMALTYLYVHKHFNEKAKEKALEMLLDIRAAFDEMVNELEWMDAGTRARAHIKLNAMKPFVGYPKWIMNAEKLNNYYEGDVIEGKLFETFLKLTNVGMNKTLSSLRETPDKERWISTGTTVNAFYSAILNSVTFPAGILHPPFYGNGLESINYGAMGAIMGHELTHGFDDQGRRYDENGNLRQWWSNETLQHYHKKVECIIKQYSNYHLPELSNNFTVNGINTQSENIADNGGIREAYRAYQISKSRHSTLQALPGLDDYTQDQLFFLGFAQIWCGNYTNGALKSKLVEGAHAPNHFRVIGTLSNNADFSQAWNCPLGSPMNPLNKCILW